MPDIWEFRVPEGAGQGHIWQGKINFCQYSYYVKVKGTKIKQVQAKGTGGKVRTLPSIHGFSWYLKCVDQVKVKVKLLLYGFGFLSVDKIWIINVWQILI